MFIIFQRALILSLCLAPISDLVFADQILFMKANNTYGQVQEEELIAKERNILKKLGWLKEQSIIEEDELVSGDEGKSVIVRDEDNNKEITVKLDSEEVVSDQGRASFGPTDSNAHTKLMKPSVKSSSGAEMNRSLEEIVARLDLANATLAEILSESRDSKEVMNRFELRLDELPGRLSKELKINMQPKDTANLKEDTATPTTLQNNKNRTQILTNETVIRMGPADFELPVVKLKKGIEVEVIEEQGDWSKVAVQGGPAGWMKSGGF